MEKVAKRNFQSVLDEQEKIIRMQEMELDTLMKIVEIVRKENGILQERIKELEK